ncbi:MAG: transposase, partial [Bacillota bacterium]
CPQTRIVFDKYHLVTSYNRDVIDEIRCSELLNKSKNNPEYKIYKGNRWLLLKNRENKKRKKIISLKNC